ncbi:MAG: DUF3306 domain-containing protein [Methylibium sp.]|uniref:DUF3306 domain-containing protein n=1 Tax=Methylibium sp. TaxID=2067992 RepID=UPI0017D1699A|nr:DUF3306 domain-containing protein [Methylibium sp.]MBA3598437.1 DUF3306 domain-containing protein [Methylibium sp.]
MSDDNFLSRWSRRKADVKSGRPAGGAPGAVPATLEPTPGLPPEPELVADPVSAPVVARASIDAGHERGTGTALSDPTALEPSTQAAPPPPAPTLEDVAALVPGDEISRFVAFGVDENVKRAAVKKLFTDPRYNIMDGLDVYIDDYGKPDPIPMAMLRKMNQSKFLGLFAEEEAAEALEAERLAATGSQTAISEPAGDSLAAAPEPADALADDPALSLASNQAADPTAPAATVPHDAHEDPDLQLQPDDAARRPGAEIGAGRERG